MPTGKGASRAFRIATAACQKRGLKSFKKGSPGQACRGRLAEKVAQRSKKR